MATKTLKKRQRIRMFVMLIALLLFPVVINYLSPYIIAAAAAKGIVNGSLLLFALLAVSALVLGRSWCAWLCPGAFLQEACAPVVSKRPRGRWISWLKWAIWIPWIGLIAALAVRAGGYHQIDALHLMDSPISVAEPLAYINYYAVLGLFVALALTVGRRGGCHSICWMAPFMILGRRVSLWLRLPRLQLKAKPQQCSDCGSCTKDCPMGLDVTALVRKTSMEQSDCILCGTCVDGCRQGAIAYSFGR